MQNENNHQACIYFLLNPKLYIDDRFKTLYRSSYS